jgi:hypothetical protein
MNKTGGFISDFPQDWMRKELKNELIMKIRLVARGSVCPEKVSQGDCPGAIHIDPFNNSMTQPSRQDL